MVDEEGIAVKRSQHGSGDGAGKNGTSEIPTWRRLSWRDFTARVLPWPYNISWWYVGIELLSRMMVASCLMLYVDVKEEEEKKWVANFLVYVV